MPSNIATTHSTPSTNRWTVTPNWRESDNPHAAATAKGIQDILNRTETLPILSNVLYRHIVTLLALSVTFALWKRHRVAGLRATRIDAVALVGIAVAVYGRFMLVAVGLTAAYAVWSALADRPWNEAGKLPGFGKFVGGLRPAGEGSSSSSSSSSAGVEKAADTRSEATTTTTTTPNAEDSTETPDCIICWSSEVPPPPPPLRPHRLQRLPSARPRLDKIPMPALQPPALPNGIDKNAPLPTLPRLLRRRSSARPLAVRAPLLERALLERGRDGGFQRGVVWAECAREWLGDGVGGCAGVADEDFGFDCVGVFGAVIGCEEGF
ncbi:hypothetical protein Q7P37_010512 [Cladosporium fusiforme]